MACQKKRKRKRDWFSAGGFENDPFLTEKDKKYYRSKKYQNKFSDL